MRTRIIYLIGQQASHGLNIEVRGAAKTYQPIQIFEDGGTGIKLGYEQAKAVAKALKKACKAIEKAGTVPRKNAEYPGCILEVQES